MELTFHSNGKLLLSAEYLVLDGAKALAIPAVKGQSLSVLSNDQDEITWKSYDVNNQVWLEVKLDLELNILETSNKEITHFLVDTLKAAKSLNPNFLSSGCLVKTHLEFPNDWGLGSSSTLISNIAQWANIDPFKLHFKVSNGSAYDIACATSNQPLLYTLDEKPKVEFISWKPTFANQIYFIHLNQKQRSNKEVQRYSDLKQSLDLEKLVIEISELTDRMINVEELSEFENICKQHEYILSSVLQFEPIKEQLFQMYQGGIVKSLGAWGGDFVMVTAKNESDLEYFQNKGYNTIVKFQELLLL